MGGAMGVGAANGWEGSCGGRGQEEWEGRWEWERPIGGRGDGVGVATGSGRGDGSGNGQWVDGVVRWACPQGVGGAMGVGAANGWVGAEQ